MLALAAATSWLAPSATATPDAGTTAASSAAAGAPNRYLLVGSTANGDVGVYGVARDGALSKAAGSPFDADTGFAVVVTPDGRKAYVASLSKKSVQGYAIGDNGALTPIPGATAPFDAGVVGLVFSPDGSRLFATVGGEHSGSVHTLSVADSGALSPEGKPAQIPGESYLSQPVAAPDGDFVYATSFSSNTVTAFRVADDGSLSQLGEPLPTGKGPALPAASPDGRFLYVTNEQSSNASGFAIQPDGTLKETPGSPYATGDMPHGAAVTPDSKRLYLPEAGSNKVSGFKIADDGALTSLPGSPYAAPEGSMPGRVVLSPDAQRMFAVDVLAATLTAKIHSYKIASDGSASPTGYPATDSGLFFVDGPSSVMTPDQGPKAEVRTVSTDHLTATFSASGSADPDGSVARYHWNFGDGTTKTTTDPEVSHTYGEPGKRTVTVTVTDDEGCSTERIFNGQVVVCNGGAGARAATEVTLP